MAETVYSDALLSTKDTSGTVVTMLPITRYSNLLSAPKVIESADSINGAPFGLLIEGEALPEL